MMTIDIQFKNKYDSTKGLSEIADKRQEKKGNKLGFRLFSLNVIFFLLDFLAFNILFGHIFL